MTDVLIANTPSPPDPNEYSNGPTLVALPGGVLYLFYVRIVSGDITMVEKLRKETSNTTTREEQVVSVWKRSPALVLGSFVLLGWSVDDLKHGAGFARVQQAVSAAASPFQEKITVGMVLGILGVLVLAVTATPLVGPVGATFIAVVGIASVLAIATRNNKTPRGDMIKVDPNE